jgi:signal transduction histidine kinase
MVALGVVVLIAMGTLVVDLFVERDVGQRTSVLVDNAMRSIALVEDLRYEAHRLTDPQPAHQLAATLATIAVDSRSYEPLAVFPGERDEWRGLQALLTRAQQDGPVSADLLAEIEQSVQRLVAINQREADRLATGIRDANRGGIFTDLALGSLTILAAVTIGLMLKRSHRHQHELLVLHFASLDERARELEAFAARVSHDLKGPLSPIALSADLLVMNEQPVVKEAATRIRRSTTKMMSIINDLLSLSVSGRPPRGKTTVAPVVTELLEELAPELRDAAVEVSIADCVAACPSDVLGQVLTNVISNASKYRSPERRLELRIDARCEGDSIEIVVGDNGIGMDAETRDHAFDPFFRARETHGAAGHGLGLAIVRRTVEALGGTCSLDSSIGRGTRVTLTLPAST